MIYESASKPSRASSDGAPRTQPAALGVLPEWNLADLYPGRDSPELAADLAASDRDAAAFAARYEGKLAGLSGAALGAAIAEYELLQETIGRIYSYAGLVHAG